MPLYDGVKYVSHKVGCETEMRWKAAHREKTSIKNPKRFVIPTGAKRAAVPHGEIQRPLQDLSS
jgi:hypothetical protein